MNAVLLEKLPWAKSVEEKRKRVCFPAYWKHLCVNILHRQVKELFILLFLGTVMYIRKYINSLKEEEEQPLLQLPTEKSHLPWRKSL